MKFIEKISQLYVEDVFSAVQAGAKALKTVIEPKNAEFKYEDPSNGIFLVFQFQDGVYSGGYLAQLTSGKVINVAPYMLEGVSATEIIYPEKFKSQNITFQSDFVAKLGITDQDTLNNIINRMKTMEGSVDGKQETVKNKIFLLDAQSKEIFLRNIMNSTKSNKELINKMFPNAKQIEANNAQFLQKATISKQLDTLNAMLFQRIKKNNLSETAKAFFSKPETVGNFRKFLEQTNTGLNNSPDENEKRISKNMLDMFNKSLPANEINDNVPVKSLEDVDKAVIYFAKNPLKFEAQPTEEDYGRTYNEYTAGSAQEFASMKNQEKNMKYMSPLITDIRLVHVMKLSSESRDLRQNVVLEKDVYLVDYKTNEGNESYVLNMNRGNVRALIDVSGKEGNQLSTDEKFKNTVSTKFTNPEEVNRLLPNIIEEMQTNENSVIELSDADKFAILKKILATHVQDKSKGFEESKMLSGFNSIIQTYYRGQR